MRPVYAFVIAIFFLLLSGCAQPNEQMTQQKAEQLVKEHMQVNYPGAKTTILQIIPQDGSWKISSEVIYGANTPCPNLSIVVYEYPKFGFVPRAQNNITSNCEVLGCKGIENCKIVMTEEAIIASHKLNNIPEVNSLMDEVGYNNVRVDATSHDSYFENKTNMTYPSVWVVKWTSPKANYSIRLILNQTGGKVLEKFVD
jgi:hypothetical protein